MDGRLLTEPTNRRGNDNREPNRQQHADVAEIAEAARGCKVLATWGCQRRRACATAAALIGNVTATSEVGIEIVGNFTGVNGVINDAQRVYLF